MTMSKAAVKTKLNKLKQQGRAIMRAQAEAAKHVPKIDPAQYQTSLIGALNYYAIEFDIKQKRAWAIAYYKKIGYDVSKLTDTPDYVFATLGGVAHLALNEAGLNEHDLLRLDNAYFSITGVKKDEVTSPKPKAKPVVGVQEHIDNKASEVIAEIEAAIDAYITEERNFSTKGCLTGLKAPVIKKIGDWFAAKLPELKEAFAGKDEQLNEGYSNLGKRGLKKLIEFIEKIVADCKVSEVATKVVRKPRAKKIKPPSVLAKNIKPMLEFKELDLRSVSAEKIVGANGVVAYNTKARKLFVYHAAEGTELTVAGTKIANWDPEKSYGKTLRKPQEQLNGHKTWGKRNWAKLMESIRAVKAKPNGRITGDWILINTF